MNEKIERLLNARNKLKTDLKEVQQENIDLNKQNKKFNKLVLKLILANCLLILPIALYSIPIIPTTTTIAGFTSTGLTPILPKSIPLDLLMYPAFIGGFGLLGSTASLVLGNILYYIPIRIIGKMNENELNDKKQILNRKILNEYNKSKKNNLRANNQTTRKKTNNRNNTNYLYHFQHTNNNNYFVKEDYTGNNKVKIKSKYREK